MSSIQKEHNATENTLAERTYGTFATGTCCSSLSTKFDRLAYAPIDGPTKNRAKKHDVIDGDSLAGERVNPGYVYFNKQAPSFANDNTAVSAVAGFKNTPLAYEVPVSGYIDKVEHLLYLEDVRSQYYT